MADHLLGRALAAGIDDEHFWTREAPAPEGTASLRRDMHPDFAALMGVQPDRPVDRRQVAALLAGRRADGKRIEGKRYVGQRTIVKDGWQQRLDPIGAYDFCFTVDKSVSVAWAFAPPQERAALLAAHHDAAEATMLAFEERMGSARLGAGGRGGRIPGHIGWMRFDHVTSRPVLQDGLLLPGDPDLHTHYSVPNVVWTGTGRVGTLDTIRLKGFFHEARCRYHAQLAHGLQALGAQVERIGSFGAAVLSAIPEPVREAFSKRTRQGEARARELAEAQGKHWEHFSPDEQARWRKAGTQARVTTGDPALDAALRRDGPIDLAAWHREARSVGWTPQTVFRGVVEKAREIRREMPTDPSHALLVKVEAARRGAARALQRTGLRRATAARQGQVDQLAGRLQHHREAGAVASIAAPWLASLTHQNEISGRMAAAVQMVVERMPTGLAERDLGAWPEPYPAAGPDR